jgi:hypothetical protein
MGLAIASEARYKDAVRCLFPQGEYWDAQFAAPQSDTSLFAQAKTAELTRLRQRMSVLLDESRMETTTELIDGWERVILGYTNVQLPLEERRKILSSRKAETVNRIIISGFAETYGLTLVDIVFPFKPSFFGFSVFGSSIFSRPAFFSVFYIISVFKNEELRIEARNRITRLMKNSLFGQSCFGTGQFLGRSFFIKDYGSYIFSGMEKLDDFERAVNSELIASNIAYFIYKL